MQVELAKSAGFCFGVQRAVDTVYKQIEENSAEKIYTYGPIIHNEEVIKDMEKKGVEVTFLGCDEKGTLDYADFDKAIKENTKAIVCTHGSNLTGNKVDVERIGEIAKKHDLLFVVDASQTAGVFPIDVQKMHIDILT